MDGIDELPGGAKNDGGTIQHGVSLVSCAWFRYYRQAQSRWPEPADLHSRGCFSWCQSAGTEKVLTKRQCHPCAHTYCGCLTHPSSCLVPVIPPSNQPPVSLWHWNSWRRQKYRKAGSRHPCFPSFSSQVPSNDFNASAYHRILREKASPTKPPVG